MPQQNLTIGALSAQAGCNVPTIRYYEQIGLLPQPARAGNGHRYYREDDLKRLTFIKRCRDFGFPIEQVRAMLSLFEDGDRSCAEARDMAQLHLDAVRVKLDAMRQLEAGLAAIVDSCTQACIGGATRDCVIIEDWSAPETRPAPCCATSAAKIQAVEMAAVNLKRRA